MSTPLPPTHAWLDGEIVAWEDCTVHARSQGAFWGANVFEGLRAYRRPGQDGLAVFRVDEHLARLGRSMKSLHMKVPFTEAELKQGVTDVLRANAFDEDVHICVVSYFNMGPNFDPLSHTDDAGVHITSTRAPRGRGFEGGLAATIASWRRISDDSMPPRIKAGANYHNSRLAHHEAIRNGYDTTLLLNQRGSVSEAPGSCVVMLRDGKLITPPGTSGVLEGITVATVGELAAKELGIPMERREIDRTELYTADEVFVAGTLAELAPVTSVDRIPVGDGAPGVTTRKLQELYDAVVRGQHPDYSHWTTIVHPTEK
ncbi:branched-chain-amino-acid transaminase [Streptomyces abyssomicinicus]|uniref:branched-chain-amino-acid transaminase n=1 Tax=Streptomyces abyssomicinicus TaxID=574929 RepID=UPI001250CA8F|nr:branched-chain-amino-acid transaminase [Streptomyces abyssomicinicus]